jgi:HK97 family phage prohead protease
VTTHTKLIRRLLEGQREARSYTVRQVEFRDGTDDELHLHGYATVFDTPYDIYGGPPVGWAESVDPGAFTRTLRNKADVALLANHGGLTLARTKSGTLRLSVDDVGLEVDATLDRSDPDVQRLEPKLRRGDLDEMSMAFWVKRQEWNEDYTERRLLELDLNKGDVSIVNYGANDATSVGLRQLLGELESVDPDQLVGELRAAGSDDPAALIRQVRARLDAALTDPTGQPATGRSLDLARRQALVSDDAA